MGWLCSVVRVRECMCVSVVPVTLLELHADYEWFLEWPNACLIWLSVCLSIRLCCVFFRLGFSCLVTWFSRILSSSWSKYVVCACSLPAGGALNAGSYLRIWTTVLLEFFVCFFGQLHCKVWCSYFYLLHHIFCPLRFSICTPCKCCTLFCCGLWHVLVFNSSS